MENRHLLYSNLIGIPTMYLASPAFNVSPLPVHINGVREMNAPLFEAMDKLGREDAPGIFMEHMRVMFNLDARPEKGKKKNYRANYLRFLRGWFFDSNRPEGGVMKGWAESRFGLAPTYHTEPIPDFNCPSYFMYMSDKMHPRFHNNSIFSQFDLLYEYAQYYLSRFGPTQERLTLYRGMNISGDEVQVVEKREKKLWVVRNNSLASYTSDIERASEFGDVILKVDVPFAKLLCFSKLLPGKLPEYESECILLGGDYISNVTDLL